ncbi:hypothetical protein [Microbacterium sp. H1-D42]|uniref:hypothetical protein n=1 Tax=Microbacterium sp. H1-D42 TaxID=2925844 RepID=UPI001F53923C|nr:hypothetical protein [Microbacterium sp. H1-D42]UNK71774.1 hypothetical protein MNR00_04770 [Microbacterium sp. H1-D42]
MDDVALAPRNATHGVIAVWAVSLVAALVLGFTLPAEVRTGWILIAFGGIVLLSFAVQLSYARPQGFIARVSASVGGALLLMGLVSAAFGISALAAAL